jgi:uncharacterized membrane protein YgcG
MNQENINIPPRRPLSIFGEFSILSFGIIAGVVALAAFSVVLYFGLMQTPTKSIVIEDKADLLTKSEEKDIKNLAEDLSEKRQINVVIVTTDRKGDQYDIGDAGSEQFAADKYRDLPKRTQFRDNSGVLMLIDMENRYVYIYTYGTAHAAVTNEECVAITDSVVPALQSQQYADAMESMIGQISDNDFFSFALVMVYVLLIGGPLLIVALVLLAVSHNKRSKITTTFATYLDNANCRDNGDQDIFNHKTVTVTTVSSSSGGGFGGGGGGGGGGGRSGGGGSHF